LGPARPACGKNLHAALQRWLILFVIVGGGVSATVAGLGLTLAGAVAARTTLTALAQLRAAGRQALQHAEAARLAGYAEPALGAVLVEYSEPAAYCVAGRYPTLILTTGAVQVLDPASWTRSWRTSEPT
jgi:hypothetical protein